MGGAQTHQHWDHSCLKQLSLRFRCWTYSISFPSSSQFHLLNFIFFSRDGEIELKIWHTSQWLQNGVVTELSDLFGAISKPCPWSCQAHHFARFQTSGKIPETIFHSHRLGTEQVFKSSQYNCRELCLLFTNSDLDYKDAAWDSVNTSRRKDRGLCSATRSAMNYVASVKWNLHQPTTHGLWVPTFCICYFLWGN